MHDILHRVGIKASPSDVYNALATCEGLAAWWTTTLGDSKVGGIIEFRFGPRGGFDMRVLDLMPGKHVLWQVVDGPQDWIDTRIRFDLTQDGDYTIVLFKHEGWRK